jgi:hypothetical protein
MDVTRKSWVKATVVVDGAVQCLSAAIRRWALFNERAHAFFLVARVEEQLESFPFEEQSTIER